MLHHVNERKCETGKSNSCGRKLIRKANYPTLATRVSFSPPPPSFVLILTEVQHGWNEAPSDNKLAALEQLLQPLFGLLAQISHVFVLTAKIPTLPPPRTGKRKRKQRDSLEFSDSPLPPPSGIEALQQTLSKQTASARFAQARIHLPNVNRTGAAFALFLYWPVYFIYSVTIESHACFLAQLFFLPGV